MPIDKIQVMPEWLMGKTWISNSDILWFRPRRFESCSRKYHVDSSSYSYWLLTFLFRTLNVRIFFPLFFWLCCPLQSHLFPCITTKSQMRSTRVFIFFSLRHLRLGFQSICVSIILEVPLPIKRMNGRGCVDIILLEIIKSKFTSH